MQILCSGRWHLLTSPAPRRPLQISSPMMAFPVAFPVSFPTAFVAALPPAFPPVFPPAFSSGAGFCHASYADGFLTPGFFFVWQYRSRSPEHSQSPRLPQLQPSARFHPLSDTAVYRFLSIARWQPKILESIADTPQF